MVGEALVYDTLVNGTLASLSLIGIGPTGSSLVYGALGSSILVDFPFAIDLLGASPFVGNLLVDNPLTDKVLGNKVLENKVMPNRVLDNKVMEKMF